MGNIIKPKEREVPSDITRKIFGIIRNKENFQHFVETSLAFPISEMTKELLNCKKQADLTRDRTIMQSRCLTRLL